MGWKVRVIHLAHTDIGYKDFQTRICKQLREDLYSVVEWLESNPKSDFVWNVECFGTIEDAILKDPKFCSRLVKQIKLHRVGLSGGYWNFSKIASSEIVETSFKRFRSFCFSKGIKDARSLITNDVNGYARSWAEAGLRNGVDCLFFGLHTHHGLFPGWKKQSPFWWKLSNGKRVLVWIGEQYAFGNDLGMSPGPMGDYIAQDGLSAGNHPQEQLDLATHRMQQYLKSLSISGYPFDFLPISVLGNGSDDDPPNYEINSRLKALEKKWEKIGVEEVKMCTLDDFFEEVLHSDKVIPTYSGEWTDWWTDGVGSMPGALKAFREAQRIYRTANRVGTSANLANIKEKLENELLLFSEHTFGYEDSLRFPHDINAFTIESAKKKSAFNALVLSNELLEETTDFRAAKGRDEKIINLDIFNPYSCDIFRRVNVTKWMGIRESERFASSTNVKVFIDKSTPVDFVVEKIGHPVVDSWSAKQIWIYIFLPAFSKRRVTIDFSSSTPLALPITSQQGLTADKIKDFNLSVPTTGSITFSRNILFTKYYEIVFDDLRGLISLKNLLTGQQTLDDSAALFQPLYVVDEQKKDRNSLFLSRREIGRNRFGKKASFNWGIFENKEIIHDSKTASITMTYKIPGTGLYEIKLFLNNYSDAIYCDVNINKNSEWANESLLIALPFVGPPMLEYDNLYSVGEGQIPGTNVDYHSIQEGVVFRNVLLNQLDSSLIWTGPLAFGERELASNDTKPAGVFTWALNNAWETNFSADTSGFHGFRYVISPWNGKKVTNISEKMLSISGPLVIKREAT